MSNAANLHTNASAGSTINSGQQTFYMAERLKKNGNAAGIFMKNHHVRHGSVDENCGGAMVIQSTNDSRVDEMLPNVINQ